MSNEKSCAKCMGEFIMSSVRKLIGEAVKLDHVVDYCFKQTGPTIWDHIVELKFFDNSSLELTMELSE